MGCLPETFQAKNLVALEMPSSRIKQLWGNGEKKVLKNLKVLDLRWSKLTTLDCGLLPNLEELNIEGCKSLVELHVPSGCLARLVCLNAGYCIKVGKQLQSLVKELQSLQVLDLSDLGLTEFPNIWRSSHSLLKLYLSLNNITEVSSSIGNLEKLVRLDLTWCRNLKSLPQSIWKLRCLKELSLNRCGIEELPEDLGNLQSLVRLTLSCTRVKHLPDSICKLKHLETLNLVWCDNLTKLPEDLGLLESLEVLDLRSCRIIRDVPSSICKLKHLRELHISACEGLVELPEKLGDLKCLEKLDVRGTNISHLPESIALLKDLKNH